MSAVTDAWRIEYADGAGNQYVLAHEGGERVAIAYRPVTPAESSSGVYSGGAPRVGSVAVSDPRVVELWMRVQALPGRSAARAMGTGAFTVTTGERVREVVVPAGVTLDAIHALFEALRDAP